MAPEQAAELEALGVTVRLGDGATLPDGTELIVTAPGWKPDKPLFAAADAAGVPVWGDVELAWRLRKPGAADWLAVTGTDGKTTTVQMLASILEAAGLRTAAVGNIGVSPPRGPRRRGVRRARRGAVQLPAPLGRPRCAPTPPPSSLNLAPDHLDWHGSMEAYAKDKGRIYEGNRVACVYNVADKATEDLVREADVEEGCRAVGFTLGTPGPSQLGVVEGLLVDRAFVENRQKNAQELAEVADVKPAAPHNIANALAAAALARAYGVPAGAVREGLRNFTPDAHRIAHVADVDGVAYVDDSKATNTHAAQASLAAYDSVVWIAGGLAKGATFDELVAEAAKRLRGAVLIGRRPRADPRSPRATRPRSPRGRPRADRHWGDAPGRPGGAAAGPPPGDTVLLAPACASMDMFANYNKRGDAFAQAVRELGAPDPGRFGAGRTPGRDAWDRPRPVGRRTAEVVMSSSRTGRPPVQRAARRPVVPRPPRENPLRTLVIRARRAWDRPLTAYYVDPRRQSADHRAGSGDGLLGLPDHGAPDVAAGFVLLPQAAAGRRDRRRAAAGGVPDAGEAAPRARLPHPRGGRVPDGPGAGAGDRDVAVNGNQNWLCAGRHVSSSSPASSASWRWCCGAPTCSPASRTSGCWPSGSTCWCRWCRSPFMLLGLIMLGGDMGTAIILTAILFGLLWLAGAPTRLFAGVLAVAALLGRSCIRTSPNRMARLACIGATEPQDRPAGCWQAVHGIYALASGGIFGSGLGASLEKWGELPEAHTDFIFAVTGEELGLAGTLSVLALFAALGYAGIRVAGRTEDPFVRYAAGGVTTWITAQAVINIGAVLGLLPIAGVPLPLFSYGGSALLPTMFAIGLLIAFARDDPAARTALPCGNLALVEAGEGCRGGLGDGTRCDGAPQRRVRAGER
ncbi:UDP-N-acetylmuramoylalanine--D-glutamate ligase [Streptomyces griseoloalbus]